MAEAPQAPGRPPGRGVAHGRGQGCGGRALGRAPGVSVGTGDRTVRGGVSESSPVGLVVRTRGQRRSRPCAPCAGIASRLSPFCPQRPTHGHLGPRFSFPEWAVILFLLQLL